jgi:hypothetical protein
MHIDYDGIRRLPDGSPDFGFYRRRAVRQRTRATRRFVRAYAAAIVRTLIALAIVATALWLVPARDGSGWNGDPPNGAVAAGSRTSVTRTF